MTDTAINTACKPTIEITRVWVSNQLTTRQGDSLMHFVGRALLVIYNNQTIDEKADAVTKDDNGIGFGHIDVNIGSSMAESYKKYKRLTPAQVAVWTKLNTKGIPRIAKYWKQLANAAK